MRRLLLVPLLMFASTPARAQTPHVVESPEIWRQREARRFENQRRDCDAQWAGFERTGRAAGQSREAFVTECAEAAARARCHPPGSNPTCLYLSRERRAGRPVPND
jgi:hypothetical protein